MTIKRFIAGATCPQCGLLDKTVWYQEEGRERTECVRCGYEQQQPTSPASQTLPPRSEHVIEFVRPSLKNKTKTILPEQPE